MPNKIAAAIFDLGGVLIEVDPERTARAWAAHLGMTAEALEARLGGSVLSDAFERGEATLEDVRTEVTRTLGREVPAEVFRDGWTALLGRPLAGVDALLDRLAGRVRLLVLTNTNATHAEAFRRTDAALLERFERVFMSFEMGSRKPEPACFEAVLAYLALPPQRVAFFDDNPANVEAAAALGLQSRLVRGPAETASALDAMGVVL